MKLHLYLTVFANLATWSYALEKVTISVYYESLCPDSRNFTLNQLTPTYAKLHKYLSLDLVPFGNVNVTFDLHQRPVYKCQHGEAECYGNRAEACAISLAANDANKLNYVKCMFSGTTWKDTHTNAEHCAKLNSLDWTEIKSCTNGSEGEKLIETNWKRTSGLNPKKTAVPWVLINGVHTAELQKQVENDLFAYVCKHYLHSYSECH